MQDREVLISELWYRSEMAKDIWVGQESRKLETVPEAARAIMSDYFRQK
jgi:hypothetical protein